MNWNYNLLRVLDDRVHSVQVKTLKSWQRIVNTVGLIRPRHIRNGMLTSVGIAVAACMTRLWTEYKTMVTGLEGARTVPDLEKKSDNYIYILEDRDYVVTKKRKPLLRKGEIWQFVFPWRYKRQYDSQTIIRLSQSPDQETREMALQCILNWPHWTAADYCAFAQGLHHRTLAALARIKYTDLRFFLPQPAINASTATLDKEMIELLKKLPLEHVDQCTNHFTQVALRKGNQKVRKVPDGLWTFDGNDSLQEEFVATKRFDSTTEAALLNALIDISRDPGQSARLVALGVLPLLQRIYEERCGNVNVLRSIAQIIANIASERAMHKDLTHTGWITILHNWLYNPDLALFLYAVKGLANMDGDYKIPMEEVSSKPARTTFQDGIYLYHPWYRERSPLIADVVFVHGLLGGPFRTWRQRDPPRPELTEKQLQQVHEWAVNHDTERMAAFYSAVAHGEDVTVCIEALALAQPGNVAKLAQYRQKQLQDAIKAAKEKRIPLAENPLYRRREMPPPPQPLLNPKGPPPRRILKPEDMDPGLFKTMEPKEPMDYSFCWPKDWLACDCPELRLLTVEYDTQISEWAQDCPFDNEKTLALRAHELMDKLAEAGVGKRPLIWVGHSMGGLLIKQMLQFCRTRPEYQEVIKNTKGLIFYSVPHRGSPLAAYGNSIRFLLIPSTEVKELMPDSLTLLKLHEQFKELMFIRRIPLLSFGEGLRTKLQLSMKSLIVPEQSSDPGFGEYYRMAFSNHLNICKPASRDCPLYLLTLNFILDCLPALKWTDTLGKLYQPHTGYISFHSSDIAESLLEENKNQSTVVKTRNRNDLGILARQFLNIYDDDDEDPPEPAPSDYHVD